MSWFDVAASAPFSTVELPYGIYSVSGQPRRVGVAVGDRLIDMPGLWRALGQDPAVFEGPSLNSFLGQGKAVWAETRALLQSTLADSSGQQLLRPHLRPMGQVQLHLPVEVADYVDFYASEHHASNVGKIFRPDSDPLMPNWKHMPIGYHGRAGSVVVSGTEVIRPRGQVKSAGDPGPIFSPTRQLDFEAELGWVVGVESSAGVSVPMEDFPDHVFGVVLLNDWSARDLQAWEYVPLGPFLGKSFATSISAWVLPLEALDEAQIEMPDQRPELLPYLRGRSAGYDIDVEVMINDQVVSSCPYATMYYSPAQMLAHLTSNGAPVRTGDIYGSGTISGPGIDHWGSLLELTWNGSQPLQLGDNGTRAFLEDGDEVVLRGVSRGPVVARLGEVRGRVFPSRLS